MTMVPSHSPAPTARTDLKNEVSAGPLEHEGDKKGLLHVVAMKMPWMASWRFIVQDNPDRTVGAKVINVPLRIIWIRGVSRLSQEQERVVVVASERGTVDCPNQVSRGVDFEINFHVDFRGRIGDCDFMGRYGHGQSIVGARIGGVGLGLRVWARSTVRIGFFVVDGGESSGLVGWLCTLSAGKCRAHPVNLFWFTNCFDYDVGALTNLDVE